MQIESHKAYKSLKETEILLNSSIQKYFCNHITSKKIYYKNKSKDQFSKKKSIGPLLRKELKNN